MYTFSEKVTALHALINDGLSPLVGSHPCAYVHLPYFPNIGDVLIWEGTEQFIAENQLHCLFRNSELTYFRRPLPADAVLLMHGGGSFGDVWRNGQEFRLKVLRDYPDNPVIILPQTVYYADPALLKQDVAALQHRKNLTICARDEVSYKLLNTHFGMHRILLLPDMAFCIDTAKLARVAAHTSTGRTLFLMRSDHELAADSSGVLQPLMNGSVEVHDWPDMEHRPYYMRLFSLLNRACHRMGNKCVPLADDYANRIIRPMLVKSGVRFLQQYDTIYTTRLHVAILSTLLHRPFTLLDNNYGKNSSLYQTWLSDMEGGILLSTAKGDLLKDND
jgi:pyruvyl transferase EpsO